MHYFTADLHLGHKNVLKHDGRPWDDIDLHDLDMADNMRPIPDDRRTANELWIIGDVAWTVGRLKKFMEAVRPHWHKIHFIRGNHDDKVAWRHRDLFDSANEALYVRISKETHLYLSHYAHRVWRNSPHGSIHIHGHSHGNLPDWGKSIDAGCMIHGYRPLRLPTILEMVKDRPNVVHHPLAEAEADPTLRKIVIGQLSELATVSRLSKVSQTVCRMVRGKKSTTKE